MKTLETKKAPAAIGPYSQAKMTGNFLFASGQIPVDPATGEVAGDKIETQAEQSCKNVGAILEEAGYGEYGMFLFRTGQKEAGQALWTEYKSKETMLDDTVSRNLRLWEKEMTKSEEKS